MVIGVVRQREELEALQARELATLLAVLWDNPFYAPRLEAAGLGGEPVSLDEFRSRVPFTTKAELVRDQEAHPPYGSNLSRSVEEFVRVHQTSSTTGAPLRWLDTRESWEYLERGWEEVYRAAGITRRDRVFLGLSFGPHIGPWLAFEAAQRVGALAVSGAGMSSEARLHAMIEHGATALICSPTYALRLVQVARETGLDLTRLGIRSIIVGAEPGGSILSVRERIERAWGATVHDYYGLTEAGAVTYQCPEWPDVVHASESLYLVEVIDRETLEPIPRDGNSTGELVLTTLGRADSPVLRYRTGDVVRPLEPGRCSCGRVEVAFERGVLGRVDDMVHVRGVNLFPSGVDAILGGFAEVAEYCVLVREERGMAEVVIHVEPSEPGDAVARGLRESIRSAFRAAYGLRVEVETLLPGSLPRHEFRARRWVRGSMPTEL